MAAQYKQPISGLAFLEWLAEAGLIPEFTRRVIIDARYDEALLFYVENIGDERLIERPVPEVLFDALLELAEKEAE